MKNPDELDDHAADLAALLPRIQAWIPETGTTGNRDEHGRHPKAPAAPAPWNDAAAALYLDIHAGIRAHERDLAYTALGVTRPARGGSDEQTLAALRRLPALIILAATRKPPAAKTAAARAARDLTAWPKACRRFLDEARPGEEPWTRAPGGLACPYCQRPLELAPGWDREPAPVLHCRTCPADPDEPTGPRCKWEADAWLGALARSENLAP